MITFVIISLALFIIGVILIILIMGCDSICFSNHTEDCLFIVGITLIAVGGVSSIVFGALSGNHTNSTKIKEYPASEYTLSYKITEFEGQRDTTYVLIPKEK